MPIIISHEKGSVSAPVGGRLLSQTDMNAIFNLRMHRQQLIHSNPKAAEDIFERENDVVTSVTRLVGQDLNITMSDNEIIENTNNKVYEKIESNTIKDPSLIQKMRMVQSGIKARSRSIGDSSELQKAIRMSRLRLHRTKAGQILIKNFAIGSSMDVIQRVIQQVCDNANDAKNEVLGIEHNLSLLDGMMRKLSSLRSQKKCLHKSSHINKEKVMPETPIRPTPPSFASRPSRITSIRPINRSLISSKHISELNTSNNIELESTEDIQLVASSKRKASIKKRIVTDIRIYSSVDAVTKGDEQERINSIRDAHLVSYLNKTKMKSIYTTFKYENGKLDGLAFDGKYRLKEDKKHADSMIETWHRNAIKELDMHNETNFLFQNKTFFSGLNMRDKLMATGERQESDEIKSLMIKILSLKRLKAANWLIDLAQLVKDTSDKSIALYGGSDVPMPCFLFICTLKRCTELAIRIQEENAIAIANSIFNDDSSLEFRLTQKCLAELFAHIGLDIHSYLQSRGRAKLKEENGIEEDMRNKDIVKVVERS